MARYIVITGGVVSSLGKGLASAALGALLQDCLKQHHVQILLITGFLALLINKYYRGLSFVFH